MTNNILHLVPKEESKLPLPAEYLRGVAEQIDAGEYGEVRSLVVVMDGDSFDILGMGKDMTVADAGWLLTKGVTSLANSDLEITDYE